LSTAGRSEENPGSPLYSQTERPVGFKHDEDYGSVVKGNFVVFSKDDERQAKICMRRFIRHTPE